MSIFSAPPSSRSEANWRLFLDQRVDLLLDGAAADELVDQHVALLPDAKGPVGGLVFDGRVPPAVEMDHVRGGGQVQARAARLEREHEKRRPVVALELIDESPAVARRPFRRGAPARCVRTAAPEKPASGSVISRNWVKTSACLLAGSDFFADLRQPGELAAIVRQIPAVAQQLAGMIAELLQTASGRRAPGRAA